MTPAALAVSDYCILTAFFVVMLAIGVFFSGRMHTLKDFFSGGNRVPWWVSGVSLYMTSFSAFAFIAYSALAYQYGFVAIVIWWSGVPCWILSARFLAARWRRAASTSPLEYVEKRYGPLLRQGFAWEGVPLIIIDDALKLFVIGKMVAVSLGFHEPRLLILTIAVCGVIMLLYTFLGGLWAVMVTDFVQFVIMAAVVAVLIPLTVIRMGGIAPVFQTCPPGFWAPLAGPYDFFWVGAFFVIQLLTCATKWPLVQRYYAVESGADARKVGYLVAALVFFFSPLLFFPGMAARIFLPGIADANAVYPLLCRELLPAGMMGMMIAAMFSATMSMLSGDYNAVAAVLTNDVYRRLFRKNASEKNLLRAGRLSTLLAGILAIGLAALLANYQSKEDLVKLMVQVFSILTPPVAIPMIFGLLTRRISNTGALAGFLTGAGCGLAAYTFSYLPGGELLRASQYITWLTALPTLFAMLVFSGLFPDGASKRAQVNQFLDGLSPKPPPQKFLSANAEKASDVAVVAMRVIGCAIGAIGTLLTATVAMTVSAKEGYVSIIVGLLMLIAGICIGWRLPRTRVEKHR